MTSAKTEKEKFLAAVKSGKSSAVKKLLNADSALVNARTDSGESAILLSVYYGHQEIRDLLLACGAELDVFEAAAAGQKSRLEALVKLSPAACNAFSHDGFTPLHLAAFLGHKACVDFLLSSGADVNATSRNTSALRPIHSAVAHRGDPGEALAIAKALVAAGAEINIGQQGGWTPLHAAAFHSSAPMVKFLLDHGADVHPKTDNGKTALAMALAGKHSEVVALLRKSGAS